MTTISERNNLSWSYFNQYRDPKVARQLSYDNFANGWLRFGDVTNPEAWLGKCQWKDIPSYYKYPYVLRPANFELRFKRGEYLEATDDECKIFYNVATAIDACNEFFGKDTKLYYYNYPGLEYITEVTDSGRSKLFVFEQASYLFPSTNYSILGEINNRLNVVERNEYKTSCFD
jgi:hypothetical protein